MSNGLNGLTGRCEEHGPYLYFCGECHEKWRSENPEAVAEIERLVRPSHRDIKPTDSEAKQ